MKEMFLQDKFRWNLKERKSDGLESHQMTFPKHGVSKNGFSII